MFRELRRTWKRSWHAFRQNADFARGSVERKDSQFGIPTTDIPNIEARQLSVGRGKGKIVPVHTMKAYRWSRSTAPLILNLSIRWKWVVKFRPRTLHRRERTAVPINRSVGGGQCRLKIWGDNIFKKGISFVWRILSQTPKCLTYFLTENAQFPKKSPTPPPTVNCAAAEIQAGVWVVVNGVFVW